MTIQYITEETSVQRTNGCNKPRTTPRTPANGQEEHISAMQIDENSFTVEKWFNSFVPYIEVLRNMPELNKDRKKMFLAEILKRNITREQAISIEINLITGQLTGTKIQNGLDISDFFPEIISCTRHDLRNHYNRGFEAGKKTLINPPTVEKNCVDIDTTLTQQIMTMAETTMALRRENNQLKAQLQRVLNRFEIRSNEELSAEIETILQEPTEDLPFGIIGDLEPDIYEQKEV